MLITTPGLVLHTIPYAETSTIAKVFTRHLGVQSYIVKGARGRTSRNRQSILQPLSCIDMVVYDSGHSTLHHVKEITLKHPSSYDDHVGNALRFFEAEVLYKTLQEGEPYPSLWDYTENIIYCNQPQPVAVTPLLFMLTVAHHLGIEPLDNHTPHTPFFDLQEGRYVACQTEYTASPTLSSMLHRFQQSLACDTTIPHYSLQERNNLLDMLIAYFQLHLSGFNKFNSHIILHTIFT